MCRQQTLFFPLLCPPLKFTLPVQNFRVVISITNISALIFIFFYLLFLFLTFLLKFNFFSDLLCFQIWSFIFFFTFILQNWVLFKIKLCHPSTFNLLGIRFHDFFRWGASDFVSSITCVKSNMDLHLFYCTCCFFNFIIQCCLL